MRVLVSSSAMEGHFFPMVPLAWALRSAGHEVMVSAPANFTETITSTGLYAAGFVPEIAFETFMLHDRHGRPLPPGGNGPGGRASGGRAWGRLAALSLAGTRAAIDAFGPDLIITEPHEFAAQMIAGQLGIPWIEHGWGIMGMPDYLPAANDELTPELADLGIAEIPRPTLVIDTCPPSLAQGPAGDAIAMRYVPYNGPAIMPDWVREERDRPRICVTFGSVLPRHGKRDFRGMLREWTTALPDLGADVVVAVAEDLTTEWNPLPEGVRAAGRLPLNLTLPACDVVVHHGGAGTTMTAVLAGVPQVIAPQIVDQVTNAARIAAAGAGVCVPPDEQSTDAIVEQCALLLKDQSYAATAVRIAAENAARITPAAVVETLETVAAQRGLEAQRGALR